MAGNYKVSIRISLISRGRLILAELGSGLIRSHHVLVLIHHSAV